MALSQKRQAGALGNEANPPRLSFNSHDDALNYARRATKESNGRLAANRLDIVERYKRSDFEFVLRLAAGLDNREYHLVFFAVPAGLEHNLGLRYGHVFDVQVASGHSDGSDPAMVPYVSQFVDRPEAVIPSAIRFELAHDIQDFRWDILGPPSVEFCSSAAKGEMGMLGARVSAGDRNLVPSAVQRGAQIADGIERNISENGGHFATGEPHLVDFVDSVRIWLNDQFVWVWAEKTAHLGVQILGVILSPRDSAK